MSEGVKIKATLCECGCKLATSTAYCEEFGEAALTAYECLFQRRFLSQFIADNLYAVMQQAVRDDCWDEKKADDMRLTVAAGVEFVKAIGLDDSVRWRNMIEKAEAYLAESE